MALAILARRRAAEAVLRRPHAPGAAALSACRAYAAAAGEESDVVILGGGPGGYVAAIKAAQLGLKTTCIEKRGTLGGTCLNVGCIPSKALLHSSHMYHEARTSFAHHGVKISNLEVDLPAMMAQKDKAVTGLTKGIEGLFKKNKVTYVKGFGKLASSSEVSVDLIDGGNTVVKGKNIIIATGSDVKSLPGITIDEKKIVSSTGALCLSADIVPSMDGEIRKQFQRMLEKQKMKFMLKTKVVGVDTSGDGVKLTLEPAAGGEQSILEADIVLVSAGRTPYTAGLGLEAIGVETDKGGRILVDKRFKTNVDGVYAIGDVIPGPMLAHKAEEDGVACVEFLAGKEGHVDYDLVPGVVYTHPEVASVGKTEEQVKASGIAYRVGKFPLLANSRAKAIDEAEGLVKVVADKETDKILGVHIMAQNAGEIIHEAVLAMQYGASSEDVARTCHAHPTVSEALKEACLQTFSKAIHI
ncbi:unnamed protein product [Alopecurus aequalis]